jgi:hypothetical protein
MSAIGIAQSSFTSRTRIIAAHADYRRSDFMFDRTQSSAMRDLPWDRRIKPMRTWAEISGYSAVAFIGTLLTMAFV